LSDGTWNVAAAIRSCSTVEPEILEPAAVVVAVHHNRTIIIYFDPRYRDLFEQTGAFKIVYDESPLLVLST